MKTFLFSFLVFFASIDIYAQMDCMHLCLDKNYCREACEMRKLCTTLFKEKRNNLTATEQSLVKQYAGLCPYDYGNAVYIARDLYALIDPTVVFMTMDVCKPAPATAGKTEDTTATTARKSEWKPDAIDGMNGAFVNDFQFTPNPSNSGKFTLQYRLNPEHCAALYIFSEQGGKVLQQKICGTENQASIDLSEQPSGVYVVRIQAEGLVLKRDRLVITH